MHAHTLEIRERATSGKGGIDMRDITAIDVRFAMEPNQSTELRLQLQDDGTFYVEGKFRQEGVWGFPAVEELVRSGQTYPSETTALLETVRDTCCKTWYHHYLRQGISWAVGRNNWWRVHVWYEDDAEECWEGTNDAPDTVDELYRAFVTFGMPPLKMGEVSSFGYACNPRHKEDSLDVLAGFLLAIKRGLAGKGSLEELDDDDLQLLDDFQVDTLAYLKRTCPDALGEEAMHGWMIADDLDYFASCDVSHAPRMQMLALVGALVQSRDGASMMMELLRRGTIDEWQHALVNIPIEESREQDRERRRQREQFLKSVDDNVRMRMKTGKVFTSHDVAKDMGITPQQASTRIRRFVTAGELVPMPGDYPRRYKAA